MEIDINKYLSEEDKKEIAIKEFRIIVRENVLENFRKDSRLKSKKRMSDYERIISNSIFYYLEGEIDNLIGQDTKELIKEGVLKTIKSQKYEYPLFRVKNAWDNENSPVQQVVIDTVKENREYIKSKLISKLESNIDKIDTDRTLEVVSEIFYEIIENKLKK